MDTIDAAVGGARPVSSKERIVAIDIVRGFALLGVLLMNNQYQFRYPSELLILSPHPFPGHLDLAADGFLHLFVEAKAVSLFSFLFGMGLAIQLERAEARGASFGAYAMRRLGALFLFGFLHVLLLWWGDILHVYAVLGFVLLLFLRRRPRTILIAGLVLVVVPSLVIVATGIGDGGPHPPMPSVAAAFGDEAIRVYRYGSWPEVAMFRFRHLAHHAKPGMFAVFLPYALGLFLLGLWTWRRGIVQRPEAHRGFLRAVCGIGIAGGLAVTALATSSWDVFDLRHGAVAAFIHAAEFAVATPCLALGYGAAILLVTLHERPRRWLAPMASVGRMALTNYLCQSLIMTWIANGYGLGLYAKLGPFDGAILCLAVFLAQILFSRFWLARFRFGPMEWLWRTMTYGTRQPLRIRDRSSAHAS
jgi:uncharacterized protein